MKKTAKYLFGITLVLFGLLFVACSKQSKDFSLLYVEGGNGLLTNADFTVRDNKLTEMKMFYSTKVFSDKEKTEVEKVAKDEFGKDNLNEEDLKKGFVQANVPIEVKENKDGFILEFRKAKITFTYEGSDKKRVKDDTGAIYQVITKDSPLWEN